MSRHRFLCLGAGEGWHANQLRRAATSAGCVMEIATYESLGARVDSHRTVLECDVGSLHEFDAILTRTMPAGSLEQITFRLAILHQLDATRGPALVNPPRSLEIAIDKFATLSHVAALGYEVPETLVVQSRGEAMEALKALGGDCIIKPLFGGEGRGVMRVRDPELAWYAFSTLQQLDAVCYVQKFVPPGGRDTRLLVIGESVIGVRRANDAEFRTNLSRGSRCEAIQPSDHQQQMAKRICRSIGLKFASVDLVDCEDGPPKVIEVNAIPGWKGAQRVTRERLARKIIELLTSEASIRAAAASLREPGTDG